MRQIKYTDIADLVVAGETDAEIASTLAADPRTVRNIPVATLHQYIITEWRLVIADPITGQRSGPMIDLYRSLPEGAAKAGVATLLAHLFDNRTAVSVLTAERADYAGLWHQLAPQLLDADQLAAMETVHGGRRYAGVTEADVTAVRVSWELEARYTASLSAGRAAINDGAQDWQTVKAAIVAAGDGWGGE